jgi:hypothetical protein
MMEIGKFTVKDYWILTIPIFILNCLDMHSTMLGISISGIESEGNPIGKYILTNWNIYFVIFLKVILFPAILLLVSIVLNNGVEKMRWRMTEQSYTYMKKMVDSLMIVLIFSLSLIVINNYLLVANKDIGIMGSLYLMMFLLLMFLVYF